MPRATITWPRLGAKNPHHERAGPVGSRILARERKRGPFCNKSQPSRAIIRQAAFARVHGRSNETSFFARSGRTGRLGKTVDLWPMMTITKDRKNFLHLTDP